jgi:hypothetical protein
MERRTIQTATLELRSFLHAWSTHWSQFEYGEQVHVRTGWVWFAPDTLALGTATRMGRLSSDGTHDVLTEESWLDNEVAMFVDRTRFLPICSAPRSEDESTAEQPENNGTRQGHRSGSDDSGLGEDITMRPVNANAEPPQHPPHPDPSPRSTAGLQGITLGVERLHAS